MHVHVYMYVCKFSMYMYMYMHTGADHTLKTGVGVEPGPIQSVQWYMYDVHIHVQLFWVNYYGWI